MSSRPYPWVPGTYGIGKAKNPVLEKFQRLARRRWGFRNLGTFVVRDMRAHPFLSTHAIPAAADQGYGPSTAARRKAIQAAAWYVEHADALDVVCIHDYAANPPRAWRCDRASWKAFPNGELGPTYRGLHVELGKRALAMSPKAFEQLWRSLPKPPKPV